MLEIFFGLMVALLAALVMVALFMLQLGYEVRNLIHEIKLILNVERAKKHEF